MALKAGDRVRIARPGRNFKLFVGTLGTVKQALPVRRSVVAQALRPEAEPQDCLVVLDATGGEEWFYSYELDPA